MAKVEINIDAAALERLRNFKPTDDAMKRIAASLMRNILLRLKRKSNQLVCKQNRKRAGL